MVMARRRYTVEQVESRRESILDAALALFDQGGLEAVSLRRVAATLGCSYAAPYRYFASKESLVAALRARAFRWMQRAMAAAIDPASDPLDQLDALAAAFIHAGREQPRRYALMFFERHGDDLSPPSDELVAAKRDALDVCTRVVAAAQASGALRLSTDPLTASHLLWAGAHGLVSLDVAGQLVMGRRIEALIAPMIRTLIVGLEQAGASAATRLR